MRYAEETEKKRKIKERKTEKLKIHRNACVIYRLCTQNDGNVALGNWKLERQLKKDYGIETDKKIRKLTFFVFLHFKYEMYHSDIIEIHIKTSTYVAINIFLKISSTLLHFKLTSILY